MGAKVIISPLAKMKRKRKMRWNAICPRRLGTEDKLEIRPHDGMMMSLQTSNVSEDMVPW